MSRRLEWLALACATFACGARVQPNAPTAHRLADAELALSAPLETTLQRADVPNAADVWLDMVRGAKRSIDLAEFYVSDRPGSRLHAVLGAIEQAADRGVHVRLLVDETFYAKYPEVPDAWKLRAHMEVRRLDLRPGVLHAKYFVVDGRDAFVGSQNFDWRSLDHIFEIGVRIHTPNIDAALERLYQSDWDLAGGVSPMLAGGQVKDEVDGGDIVMAASPKRLVPEAMWDLPRLITWIHETQSTLRIESLTYKTKNRDGSEFHDLDDALRDAAKRGVHVELLVSTWSESDPAVQALVHVPNVEVRVLAIPPFSGGEIPFARVAHAKYALFDGARAWIGTSNWEGDYFFQSRNVSLFFEHGGELGSQLSLVFVDAWRSAYARPPHSAAP